MDNQILKAGFTSREMIIVENDDPGGVFEFSPFSRGPWIINVCTTLLHFCSAFSIFDVHLLIGILAALSYMYVQKISESLTFLLFS